MPFFYTKVCRFVPNLHLTWGDCKEYTQVSIGHIDFPFNLNIHLFRFWEGTNWSKQLGKHSPTNLSTMWPTIALPYS